jgi:hypothetical protein
MEENKKSNFTLPNDIVTVRFIKRKRGMAANVSDNHIISGGMLPNAKKKFCAPIQASNGVIVNILDKHEKEYLESITGLNLSVYGDFWQTFYVTLSKDDSSNIFNLSNPMDYLAYKMLLTLVDTMAPNWEQRNDKQTYEFVITKEGEIQNEKKAKSDIKKESFKAYIRIEDDKDKLLGVLKLLSNQPISENSTLDWIQGKVQEYVDDAPEKFLSVLQDPYLETKVLINKGVEHKLILKKGNKYETVDGLVLSENGQVPSFNNAVRYLEDPKNQEVKLFIEAKLNNK